MKQKHSPMKGHKYGDPYEVFCKVFRDEFGEDFVPGMKLKTKTPSELPPKAQSPASLTKKKSSQQSPRSDVKGKKSDSAGQNRKRIPVKQSHDRALTGKTSTKHILHDNGMVETITTTIITRANGEKERISKSSMEKLSKAEHAKLFKKRRSYNSSRKCMVRFGKTHVFDDRWLPFRSIQPKI